MNTYTLRTLRTACPSRHLRPVARFEHKSTLLQNHFRESPTAPSISLLYPDRKYARYSSTSAASKSATATSQSLSKVNGPASTLPAPITIPTRDPSQSAIKHYYSMGKAFLGFYKVGVKNIYSNYLASRPIQSRIDKTFNSSLIAAAESGTLSRSDFQLLVRNWHDVKRVPVFALVFMICGEFTPLIVIALSNVVPWTCRIPRQIQNDRKKLEQRRQISFRNLTLEPPSQKGVDNLERMQLLHISWSLGLSSSFWDWLGGQLPGLPTPILRRKVGRRVQYLETDDLLIGKWGGVKQMELEEVRMALIERGIDVLGKKDGELKGDLNAWLRSSEKVPVERLLLTR